MYMTEKNTKIKNVEIVDNSYRVYYEKIYNNSLHCLYKNFKTYNAAKRFKTRLIFDTRVRNIQLVAMRDDIDF